MDRHCRWSSTVARNAGEGEGEGEGEGHGHGTRTGKTPRTTTSAKGSAAPVEEVEKRVEACVTRVKADTAAVFGIEKNTIERIHTVSRYVSVRKIGVSNLVTSRDMGYQV